MSDQYTIFVGDDRWFTGALRDDDVRVHPIDFDDDATIASRIEAARLQLESIGYQGQPIMLGPPSSWCLCAEFLTEGLERRGRRSAMGFLLEEHLPISAEDVVADYLDTGDEKALGVCCELEKLQPIVDAMEACGIAIRHICPAAMLTAAHVSDMYLEVGGVLVDSGGDDVREGGASNYDLIQLQGGAPTCWRWFAGDREAVCTQLTSWGRMHESPAPVMHIGSGNSADPVRRACDGIELVELEEVSHYQAAVRHAAKLLNGSASPWIDLRRDAMAAPKQSQIFSKPLGAVVTSAILLLVSVCAVCQWRGRAYQDLQEQYARQQVSVFKDTLPTQRIPGGGIKRRLLSERRKIAELSGKSLDDSAAKPLKSVSALWRLHDVLKNLPKGLRYRILDWSIQPDQIRISGQARSHADADRIASALRQSGLYDVDPPVTHALGKRGVSFEFVAKPPSGQASKPLPGQISLKGGSR